MKKSKMKKIVHRAQPRCGWHRGLFSPLRFGRWVRLLLGVDTVFASKLSLSGSCLMESYWTITLRWTFWWCCLPTGFSWILFFVQMTKEKIMSSCLGPTASHIMNDRTLPTIFTAGNGQKEAMGSNHFVFVDNPRGLRCVQGLGERDKAVSCVREASRTHEQEVESGIVTCLGDQFDCVEHRSSPHGREVLACQEGSWVRFQCETLARTHLRGNSRTLHLSWSPGARLSEHISSPFTSSSVKTTTPASLCGTVHVKSWCVSWAWCTFCKARGGSLGVELLLPLMPTRLDTLCVLGSGLNRKCRRHGRVSKRNPGPSARDSFFQANAFVKGADGLWHPCVEECIQCSHSSLVFLSSDSSKNETGV